MEEQKRSRKTRLIATGCMPDPIRAIEFVMKKDMAGVRACNKCSDPKSDNEGDRRKYGAEYSTPPIRR